MGATRFMFIKKTTATCRERVGGEASGGWGGRETSQQAAAAEIVRDVSMVGTEVVCWGLEIRIKMH